MTSTSKQLVFPPIGKHIEDLQNQLKESVQQYKSDRYNEYKEIKNKKLKEINEQNKYKIFHRKIFNSQSKQFGGIFEKERDIYLCKEPLLNDYLKYHIIEPQRNLEKGLIEIKTGTKEFCDGSCFGEVPLQKLGEKERKLRECWLKERERQAKLKFKALIDSQTGVQKKLNQSKRLKELKVFIPNKFSLDLFDEHPSQILALTQLHQHSKTMKWKPNKFYGEVFDNSFCKLSDEDKSILKDIEKADQQQ
ncbi:unnamed protein product (macronuclear) [Paramecium tetraurelia]|uniref:Uncharacterized protein n=1 Tax=Paramecium tetraurelia TaxID=5888 RepID=A0CEX7_PARTE|nr:uncharacterized protein GSPATT00037783001 [Paramecium tetraurelia]CAK69344.1 unnamed protein product [Paramecium tetraurelia]|eukprot:XP_001436741.1 hypothetical protein (macronuclear) [Paramecium tetraurelia strain d4-2]